MGGLALEHCNLGAIRRELQALSESDIRFTVCLSCDTQDVLALCREAATHGLERVILCSADADELEALVSPVQKLGVAVLVEATSLAIAYAAQELGADGIVVKGNESGGLVGEETTFILLQRVVRRAKIPVWARGGIGLHSAGACWAAGAVGVVLDWQLALCEESELDEDLKARVARMDGSETVVLGQHCSLRVRAYSRPGESAVAHLKEYENTHHLDARSEAAVLSSWRREVESCVRDESDTGRLLLIGQDAAMAAPLAKRFGTVKGVCEALRRAARDQCRSAARHRALGPEGPLAQAHGTPYPILQGPMTRVSDTADFADAVATGGALPFLALALLRGPRVAELLEETKRKLGDRPWGVGILGFVPKELREEQLAEVRKHPPTHAIIAGGRPDQARFLERQGIATYVHVPSPGLLEMFLRGGVRRVIFEGRECGGHVGPRTSFVLWDTMIRVILDHLDRTRDRASDYQVVFAGGIHDAVSSSMVAAMAAPLSDRGVQIGVLLGTSYLFTKEAVETGAITRGFQEEAIACHQTILLETGVGHATRCADTAFGQHFAAVRARLIQEGRSKEEIRETLEMLNLGRLRIASKGIIRGDTDPRYQGSGTYQRVDDRTQRRDGMYMIGQVAALRERITTIGELHEEVSRGGVERLGAFHPEVREGVGTPGSDRPCDVAIIGMSCLLPQAPNLRRFWDNIVNKVNTIVEIPPDRWESEPYFDRDRRAPDKIYSKWGGFIDDVPFDPLQYGMPPNTLPSIEPLHLMVLEAVRHALHDAGYTDRPFDREHTSVILGAGGGVADLGLGYGFRSLLPYYMRRAGAPDGEAEALIERLGETLPEWTEDSFAGLLLNVAAGRVANRFDLRGTNYTVDAACASSLAAVRLAVNELETGSSNLVIVGGADTMQSPFAYLCFSKTQALSPTGKCRTFDEAGDGIVISEGIAIAVLKRLEDARRDGDRIYAIIKGVGSSSDGKDKGLTAPRPAGQISAMQRAYAKAGVSPETVGLIEAHGTGTVVGDQSEMEALTTMFSQAGAPKQNCALGSVKSMIGHTKCTAGLAGLLKAALALHHKVLPPTLGVTQPNSKANFKESPFHVNTETRPWLARADGAPRRAGVSAFGFGGTNFHAVLEEHAPEVEREDAVPGLQAWPAELFLWRASSTGELVHSIDRVTDALAQGAQPLLRDLAAAVCRTHGRAKGPHGLAVVATSIEDFVAKLSDVKAALTRGDTEIHDPRGVYYSCRRLTPPGRIAFVFPGQGSQTVNMLRELSVVFPEVREVFEKADRALGETLGRPLSALIFPPPRFTDEDRAADQAALTETRVAQPAIGAADLAMLRLLSDLGIRAELMCGHSYGEYVALCAAGALTEEDLLRVSEARGRLISEAARDKPGTMAAVQADEATVAPVVASIDGVAIANLNAPTQTVISGTQAGVEEALRRLSQRDVIGKRIAVSCAFHSPLVADAQEPFRKVLESVSWTAPRVGVYSNTTASLHETDPSAIRKQLAEHLLKPVRFVDEIQAMYDAGARVFVEVGPGKTLTTLIERILEGRPFTAVATARPGRSGLVQLIHALAQLAAAGVPIQGERLFAGRTQQRLDLSKLVEQSKPAPPSPTTWMVNGTRAVPVNGKPNRSSLPTRSERSVEVKQPVSAAPAASASPRPTPTSTGIESPPGVSQATTRITPADPAPAAPPIQGDGVNSVMGAYQQLMTKFLDTQRNVMLSYLQGGGASAAPSGPTEYEVGVAEPAPSVEAATPVPSAAPDDPRATPPIESLDATPAATETSAEPSSPAADDPSRGNGLTRERLIERLVELVSDRTGYPPDMLDLDLDLEADLGIDSIKRIEILGALQEDSMLPEDSDDGDMEVLARLKTLRAVADWVMERASGSTSSTAGVVETPGATASAAGPRPKDESADPTSSEPTPRMLLEAVECPMPEGDTPWLLKGAVLITDDEGGVATLLAQELTRRGATPVVVGMERSGSKDRGYPRVDLADREAAGRFLDDLRKRHGRIGAILHLSPLTDENLGADPDAKRWTRAMDAQLHSLFNMAQHLESDLRYEGAGWLMAATRMGGTFGSAGAVQEFWPGHGAICGWVKTAAREWTDVTCRAVDFDFEATTEEIAHALMAELEAGEGPSEVGYRAGRRLMLQPVVSPLGMDDASVGEMSLDADSVVLITGGARGITAEVAVELAERFHCTLVLLGRSPLPPEQESASTADLTEPKALKAVLLNQIKETGEKPTPARIEVAYKQLWSRREIRANLAAMRAAGATVAYHSVDVTDARAFGAWIDEVYERYGRLDGVVHGAGVIEDKFIGDKTPESFRRVVAPKVTGALVLASKLRKDSLRFLFFFSSVTARYGNRGQCDYAAANEVLNKLAIRLNARWPGRVASLNWGPWKTRRGMVSDELARQFAKAGVHVISPAAGRRAFMDELLYGDKAHVEVLYGGPMSIVSSPAASPVRDHARSGRTAAATHILHPTHAPLLAAPATVTRHADGHVEVIRAIDPAHDLFLLDHQLDGKPVMPMAMALELLCEVAATGWPDLHLVGVRQLQTMRGIVIDNGPRTVRVLASVAGKVDGGVDVQLRLESNGDRPRLHYTAIAELRPTRRTPPDEPIWSPADAQPLEMSLDEIYEKWLFQGPLFAGIVSISAIGREGITGRIAPSSPKRLLSESPDASWLIDPVVLDSALQMAIIWTRTHLDATPLPTRVGYYALYGASQGDEVDCELQVTSYGRGPAIHTNIVFRNAAGAVIGRIDDLEGTCSKALNRLASTRSGSAEARP